MRLKLPTAHSILLILTLAVAIAAQFIPAGKFDKLVYDGSEKAFVHTHANEDVRLPATQETLDSLGVTISLEKFRNGDIFKPIAIPGTYVPVAANPPTIWDLVQAPVKGTINAVEVVMFVLIIGGFIGVVNHTKAFDEGINMLTQTLRGKEYLLIIITTTLSTLGGTTFGMGEELVAFIPLLIPVFIAAGYDAMIATCCLFFGSSLGCTIAITNPFSTIIASDSAGINWTAGTGLRVVALIVAWAITIVYLLWYGKKIKVIPQQISGVAAINAADKPTASFNFGKSWRSSLILVLFAACFILMIYGVAVLDWWFTEMSTIFFVGSLVIGFISKLPERALLGAFMTGAGDLIGVSLIIGIARGISVLMDESLISDSLLYYASQAVSGMQGNAFSTLMMFVFAGLSFFVPSTSGLAVLTMPVFAPLGDTVGVSRETIVNAYMFGSGWFNFFNPTSLVLVFLSASMLSYKRYLKIAAPLLIILLLLLMVVLWI